VELPQVAILDALTDPNHEQHEELSDWIGEGFDPQAFSVDLVGSHPSAVAPKCLTNNPAFATMELAENTFSD
jgi:hypothetical protein